MASYYEPYYTVKDKKENERSAKMKESTKNVIKTIKNFVHEHKRDLIMSGGVLGAMCISYKIGSLITANEIEIQLLKMAISGEITFNKDQGE